MSQAHNTYIDRFNDDLSHYLALMHDAFEGVIAEGVSKYPVFIFHQQDINVGLPIADRNEVAGNWSVNISTLEEFYIKGLVSIEQVDEIKHKIAGQVAQYCCLVLSGEEGSLVFIPRQPHDEEE